MTIDLALRTGVILVVAWVMAQGMFRATAATRHLLWRTGLTAVVLTAVLAPWAPIPAIPVLPRMPGLTPPGAEAPTAPGVVIDARVEAAAISLARGLPPALPWHPRIGPLTLSFETVATAGTLVVGWWFFAAWIAAARLTRAGRPAPVAWDLEVNTLRERLRIAGEVRLRIIDAGRSPVATGLLRPAILLPACALRWSDDRRRAVLLHELAHIERRDCQAQLVAHVACALFWFNPLVWTAARAMRAERERACDDKVLCLGAVASSYATHLLDIARELQPQRRPSAALAMARPSELEGRLLAVLAAGRTRVPARGARAAVVTILSTAAVAASAATTRPTIPTWQAAPAAVTFDDLTLPRAEQPEPLARTRATARAAADPRARERATLTLAITSGRDVIPDLLDALRDPDAQVRQKAAVGLALRRDARIVSPLAAALEDSHAQVREKAAIALGTSGDRRASAPLTRALADRDANVRKKAAAALVLLGMTARP